VPQYQYALNKSFQFDSIDTALADLKAGRSIVVVDDESRENEGDLICAAQFATPDMINFMAVYARGLICLAMTGDRLDELDLPLMVSTIPESHNTPFSNQTAFIDAKSGTSGGGRQAKVGLLLAEADNSLGAYGVASHRHTPEIEQICSDLAGHQVTVQFTPHLIPMVRGILTTVYATLRDPGLVRDDMITIYTAFYRNSPWVSICNSGTYPQTKWACGSNRCYIGIEVDGRTGRIIVMSAIDNLIKGQAGQAIQCLNLMMGWEETLGLPKVGFYP